MTHDDRRSNRINSSLSVCFTSFLSKTTTTCLQFCHGSLHHCGTISSRFFRNLPISFLKVLSKSFSLTSEMPDSGSSSVPSRLLISQGDPPILVIARIVVNTESVATFYDASRSMTLRCAKEKLILPSVHTPFLPFYCSR
jgi:hypothetical protein